MTLKLHNTLTGKKDSFRPLEDKVVKIYSCGPTVYDYPHIGNWFGYVHWDILTRLLLHEGYEVDRVINITDVGHLTSDEDTGEDKLVKKAQKESKTAWEIADFYTNYFRNRSEDLDLVKPRYMPRATEFIDQQFELVRILKEKGFTYQIDDGIYFDTSKFKSYANFAHLDLDKLKAGARVENNPQKRNPSDFALWKFSPADEKRDMEWETPEDLLGSGDWKMGNGNGEHQTAFEPSKTSAARVAGGEDPFDSSIEETVESPTGDGSRTPRAGEATRRVRSESELSSRSDQVNARMGFPGWHLECSAMAMSLLGETIDIHTGGIDHIPVHHTNEIAQSEAATDKKLSNFWIHNNHLKSDGTKLSKSLGNTYTLEDLEEKGFSATDYRMFVLQSHYSNEANFSFDNLEAAANRLRNWRNTAALRHQTHDTLQSDEDKLTDDRTVSLHATSQAIIEALRDNLSTPEALTIIDDAFSRLSGSKITDIHQGAFVSLLETIDELLGLKLIKTTPDINDEQKQLIMERKQARKSEDWRKSDEIRDALQKQGIALRDNDQEVIWQYSD